MGKLSSYLRQVYERSRKRWGTACQDLRRRITKSLAKKTANESASGEQASPMFSDLLSLGFSNKEAFVADLMQESPFMEMLRAEENLKGVPKKFKEPPELMPMIKHIAGWDDCGTITMDGKRIARFETERWNQIQGTANGKNGIWYFDPQADEPLPDHMEKAMKQMGPANYLKWICENYKINMSSVPDTEWQAVRYSRVAVRTIPEYDGEKFHQ